MANWPVIGNDGWRLFPVDFQGDVRMIRYPRFARHYMKSSLGGEYASLREEPEVPSISPNFLDCAVYLYRNKQEALSGSESGCTGFIVSKLGHGKGWLIGGEPSGNNLLHLFVVTNSHPIVSNDKKRFVRLETVNGAFDVLETQEGDWIVSDEDDLAVLPLSYHDYHKYRAVAADSFVSENNLKADNRRIGLGDEIFMVGRFVHDGKQRTSPSVRFGHLSVMPDEPVMHKGSPSGKQVAFLVELYSIGGYSGSPVFIWPRSVEEASLEPCTINTAQGKPIITGLQSKANSSQSVDRPIDSSSIFAPDPIISKSRIADNLMLLGINCGHLSIKRKVYTNVDGKEYFTDHYIRIETGIAIIVPAWKLRLLLEHNKRIDEWCRKEQEKQKAIISPSQSIHDE